MTSPLRDVLFTLGVPADPFRFGGADGHAWLSTRGTPISVHSPIDGALLAELGTATPSDMRAAIERSADAHRAWRVVPAPRRGELVRRFAEVCRSQIGPLAEIVSREVGKITAEARGEVQELIDVCDFAVGLSRQLHGLTIASERPGHRLMEQWHPLGPVGVITAFNFPVAVWGWNAMLALVCGDSVIWKPSEKAPLSALATHSLLAPLLADFPEAPMGLVQTLLSADRDATRVLVDSPRVPLISATGSTAMGRDVAQRVAARLGRTLLELGGNNALIVCPSADMELAVRSIVFAAAGTCGQRCTTLRRLFVHETRYNELLDRLRLVYARLPIGDPTAAGVLVGPLIDEAARDAMRQAFEAARAEGGVVHFGDELTTGVPLGGVYVRPAIVEMPWQSDVVCRETFAPILYVMKYRELEEAIELHNDVPQGLSSAILTNDLREAELFLSPAGSDCGIANVNVGTSGAEIGGAFGGEKETGGGRESGSDAWKNYMRRTTHTINYSRNLPLAQGIRFDVG